MSYVKHDVQMKQTSALPSEKVPVVSFININDRYTNQYMFGYMVENHGKRKSQWTKQLSLAFVVATVTLAST